MTGSARGQSRDRVGDKGPPQPCVRQTPSSPALSLGFWLGSISHHCELVDLVMGGSDGLWPTVIIVLPELSASPGTWQPLSLDLKGPCAPSSSVLCSALKPPRGDVLMTVEDSFPRYSILG